MKNPNNPIGNRTRYIQVCERSASNNRIFILLDVGIMQVFHTIRNDNAHYKQQMHGRSAKKRLSTLNVH